MIKGLPIIKVLKLFIRVASLLKKADNILLLLVLIRKCIFFYGWQSKFRIYPIFGQF